MLVPATTVCRLASFFIGFLEVQYSTAPVGSCSYCCAINDTRDIQYKLYTRANQERFQIIPSTDLPSLSRSLFNSSRPTIVYLPGFSERVPGLSTTTIKDAYLRRGDYNFIAVDWSILIAFPWYITAVRNTRYMGGRLAQFIQFLSTVDVPVNQLHVIGFSLGAEAAGFAGKILNRRGLRIGRITGLDPAYPGYSLTGPEGHLTKGDAMYVDVVHTNPGFFGFLQPIGDVDFYPNHDIPIVQPGCLPHEVIANRQISYLYGCSHNRSWRLYAESVNNPSGFPSTSCNRWTGRTPTCSFTTEAFMGFGASPPMAGQMFLKTNPAPPFARNGP